MALLVNETIAIWVARYHTVPRMLKKTVDHYFWIGIVD